MKKQSYRFIPTIFLLLVCATVLFFFSTLSMGWKIVILLIAAAATYGLHRAAENFTGSTAVSKEGERGHKKTSLQDLSMLLEYNDAIISILNAEMHTLFRSPAAARITGWADAEFGLRSVAEHCHPEDCTLFLEVFQKAIAEPDQPQPISFRLQHRQGHYIWLEGWITNMLNRISVQGVVTNLRDVTSFKKMAAEKEKNRRFYQFLSEVNHMIVHATTEEGLFREACRIAVRTGGYRYAFIALANAATAEPVLVSYADSNGLEDGSTGEELLRSCQEAAREVMNGEPCVMQPVSEPGQQSTQQTQPASSVILLPVSVRDRVQGLACLWPGPGYLFDKAEVTLLTEMAADISYSLTHLREEQVRLKAQQDLQESERRYQVLAESAPVGIFHTDPTGYTTFVNRRWREISGLKESSALGDDWLAAVHPVDRENLKHGWQNATHAHQSSSTSEYRFLKSDGSVVHVLGLAVAQTDPQGMITGYIGTIIDITERKKAEQDIVRLLQEVTSEKALSDSIINSLPGIFYLYDREGHFIRWNADFSQVSGYDAGQIRAMHPLDFFTEEDRALVRMKIEQTFLHGEESVQADFVTASGTRIPYYFTGKRIQYQGAPCLLGVGIDFSERVAAQQKIRETTDQLRLLAAHLQAVREEERKSIGREIHDELGQTLTAIKMDIAWMNKRVTDDKILHDKLKNVTGLLDRSNRSVRKILTELRPGIFESASLLDAMRWLMLQFSETTGSEISFECDIEELELPDAVSTCIFRVAQEALTNITRYAKALNVKCSLRFDGSEVELTIDDDGVGFDPAKVALHKSFGILGMKERVLSVGGLFDLKSGAGSGTRISIQIPVKENVMPAVSYRQS